MFTFKQFAIKQDRVAMKVCTDACVLGAYADVGPTDGTAQTRILDIGTGMGLLALMAAQRNPNAYIDAIDLDETAVEQATENAVNSPFADRVRVVHSRVQEFTLPSPPAPLPMGEGCADAGRLPSPPGRSAVAVGVGGYDRILTNPPFYTNHLRPPDPAAIRAGHTDDLPVIDLLTAIQRLLKPNGQWWVLLPPYQTDQLIKLARTINLRPFQQLFLHHQADKPAFRIVTGFAVGATSVGATNGVQETLAIREMDQAYTADYRALLRDFYLIF